MENGELFVMFSITSNRNVAHWARWHKQRAHGPLGGATFKSMKNYYGIGENLHKDMCVLEIGVGFGYCVRGFNEAGCRVWAMDICKEAFYSVADVIEGSYLHEKADTLPDNFFDLIVCHVVTQHMSESDILFQFPHVIRSLKDDGVFMVQFADSDIAEENNISETIFGEPADNKVTMLGGRMVRTPDYAKQLIEQCGGEVIHTSGRKTFPQYKSGWYFLKVRRK